MNEDLKLIKRKFGEEMAHFCREYFPILLETKGLLPNLLLKKFEPNKFLYNDIVESNLEEQFKIFIYGLVDSEKEKEEKSTKSPEELLSEAGYNLYECHTEEDIQRFKKYYHEGEELCTFHGGRLNSCYVFFAVKRDVDNIKRDDFQEPKREDLYGTSIISIQFSRNSSHLLSIKNRYNHTVVNPDATFSNNLDNIIPGLTKSFEDYYGMKQRFKHNSFEIPNYFFANDSKYYKYNYEIDNIYYCPNNIIIDTDGIHKFEHDKYIVLDYFILDLVNKKIDVYDKNSKDSFPKSIGKIKKIDILKTDYGKEIRIINENNEVSIIKINKENKIIGYTNENVKAIESDFLCCNKSLKQIELPNVEIIGRYFLGENTELKEICLPKVTNISGLFLMNNKIIKNIYLLNVREIGNYFLLHNNNLKEIYLPNVEKIGFCFLVNDVILKEIYLPKVRFIGACFLDGNLSLKEICLPNVEKIDRCFLSYNKKVKILDAPNLLEIHPSQSHEKLFRIVKKNQKKSKRESNKRLIKR